MYIVCYGQDGFMSTGSRGCDTEEEVRQCVEEIKSTVFDDPKYEFEKEDWGYRVYAPGHELNWTIEVFELKEAQ
jgi:hypothetical protein